MKAAIPFAMFLCASPAFAQRGLGVGAEGTLGSGVGEGGAAVVYDLDSIYVEGSLAFATGDAVSDSVTLGAGCFYKVASTSSSDFGLGGSASLLFIDPPIGDADIGVSVDVGGKIRAFVVENVAVQVGLGLNIVLIDDTETFTLSSRLAGSAGMVYFF